MSGQDQVNKIIKEYIKIDDQLKEINNSTKELKKTKSDHENTIKEYMINNGIGKIELGTSGVLRIAKSKQKKPVNKKIVLEVLVDTLNGDHVTANKKTEEIFNEDGLEENSKLERKNKK